MSQQFKLQLTQLLQQFPLQRASLFGSYARNEETETSDIDILIEPKKGFTIFDMLRMEQTLEEKLNRKIDLVEFAAIKPSIRERVLQQAITLI